MKKKTVFIIAGVFVIVLLWRIAVLVFGGGVSALRGGGSPPVPVEAEEVSTESIKETRQLTGTIYPQYQYTVAPKVAGRIVGIYKQIGDWVDEGNVIAKIDDAEYRQAVLEAQANLRIAQANLVEVEIQFELAKQELERIQSLQEKGIASPSELDASTSNYNTLESRVKLANAQVEQRQAALNSARIRQNYTTLTASKPGFIGERFVDEGNLLSPNAPVALVVGIDTVIVRTTVIERVYGRVQVGQSSEVIVDAFADRPFEGKVMRIAPMLREASRVAQMEIEVTNDSLLLKPGMFCTVNLVLSEKESAQVVPSRAVVVRDGNEGVFLIDQEEPVVHFVPIEIGITNSERTEVVSPKLEGKVVTLGQHLLREGSRVILPGQKAEK